MGWTDCLSPFCYCLTVGLLYTHDIKKYFLRLGAFALISQPFWIPAFKADDFWGNLLNLKIFFSLIVSLAFLWGIKEKKWWVTAACILLLCPFNFDYAFTGPILMLIFYFAGTSPGWGHSFTPFPTSLPETATWRTPWP